MFQSSKSEIHHFQQFVIICLFCMHYDLEFFPIAKFYHFSSPSSRFFSTVEPYIVADRSCKVFSHILTSLSGFVTTGMTPFPLYFRS